MASVITSDCTKCKQCLAVCPVEAFREDTHMLIIDPQACIDCGACIPECPTHAIYAQEDLPERFHRFKLINKQRSKILPSIKE